ncbi:protein of unknown function [Cupriavidus taiwanensis]|uniref:Uncharacterized protein n=1 Tax=Cupriavidus taiwanensis TaxID=164546 RepID=A0A375IHG5_9BURK|nr:protein of unknown function [Cupriavidus taiwanensis]
MGADIDAGVKGFPVRPGHADFSSQGVDIVWRFRKPINNLQRQFFEFIRLRHRLKVISDSLIKLLEVRNSGQHRFDALSVPRNAYKLYFSQQFYDSVYGETRDAKHRRGHEFQQVVFDEWKPSDVQSQLNCHSDFRDALETRHLFIPDRQLNFMTACYCNFLIH